MTMMMMMKVTWVLLTIMIKGSGTLDHKSHRHFEVMMMVMMMMMMMMNDAF